MYSEGLLAAIGITSVLAHKKRHRKNQHRHDERAQKDANVENRLAALQEIEQSPTEFSVEIVAPLRMLAEEDPNLAVRTAAEAALKKIEGM